MGRRPRDEEFAMMKRFLAQLATLDPDARGRVLDYVNARVHALPKEPTPHVDGAEEEPPLIRHIKTSAAPERPKPGKTQ